MGSTWKSGSRPVCVSSWRGNGSGCHGPGAFVASVKPASNEKGYLDSSGHRPAAGRMWLSDTGRLSVMTGLSCRRSLGAVCPVLPGASAGLAARGSRGLGKLESQPEGFLPSTAQRRRATPGEGVGARLELEGPLQSPSSWNSHPQSGHGWGTKDQEVGRERGAGSACGSPTL